MFESKVLKQSLATNHVIKVSDTEKIVYRISTNQFYSYPTTAFFFDPKVQTQEFKIQQSELLTPSDLAHTRLETTAIFGIGVYIDEIPRFKTDDFSRLIYFLVVALVALGIFVGLCEIRVYYSLRIRKKLKESENSRAGLKRHKNFVSNIPKSNAN